MGIPVNPEFAHGSQAAFFMGLAAAPRTPVEATKLFTDDSTDHSTDQTETTTFQPAQRRKTNIPGLSGATSQVSGRVDAPSGEIYRELGATERSGKHVVYVECPFGNVAGALYSRAMVSISARGIKVSKDADVTFTCGFTQSGTIDEGVLPAGGVLALPANW